MKRNLLIAAIVLPLAFLAGRIGNGVQDSAQTPVQTALPAKAGDRTTESQRGAGKSGSPQWSILRRRAGLSTDELLDELFFGVGGQFEPWLIDQLLATDPERLFREIYRRSDGGMLAEVTRRWCTTDPERALPLLLGKKEPFAWKGRDFYDPLPPVRFSAMGVLDPEEGLAMIDALPASKRRTSDYPTLLEGIASAEPGKALDYFEKILSKGEMPANQVGRMLNTVATADPQAALAWAKGRYDPVPPALMASLLDGMSKADPAAAARLYEETSPKPGGSALYQVQLQLARKSSDLDATWQWVERNVEPASLARAKAETMVPWARKNPDAAVERIFANPELISSDRSYELARLVKTSGRGEELMALAQQMPEEQAAALKRSLRAVGAVPPEPGLLPSHQQVLDLMRKNPEQAEIQWQSFTAEQRQSLIEGMSNDSGFALDPTFILKRLVEGKADLSKEGGRHALGRLSLLDPQAAARLVEEMPAGEVRNKMVHMIRENWSVDDEAAATEWSERMAPGE